MNYIEQALFEKAEKLQDGHVYSDQWKFARSYVPKVLDTISHIFPHYSLHNSSHSEAILNNIIKILGVDSINKLSIVDLWLLLTASYYHDCGMVVTSDDKKNLFGTDSDFIKFIEEKQGDASSCMYQYAKLFEIKNNLIYYKNHQLTCESYEAARFLIAEYIRNKHAERSGERIDKENSLHFPGDPIPNRIIHILKSICSCHTKNVSEVLKLQSIEASGCGIEDCHPRFIAAMLRLGDLLDVDSNRVSEVLLSTLGSIPSDSKLYNQTNHDITHIRIDESIIELTAECSDYHVADLINRWFQCLNDELVFYMKHWHIIIPNKSFCHLPTVGDLKVNLSNYDTLDGKKRPCFNIDSNKALELLQGAGLYTDPYECIRELLQNAVDATYLRIYKENIGINDLDMFRQKCKEHPIKVILQKNHEQSNEEYTSWDFELIDEGIGMTKEDIKFLSTTGGSTKNKDKKQLIYSVPDFLRPSGAFGIGFQSVFLITDQVKVITRKLYKDNYVEAEMYDPSGVEKGAILIKSVCSDDTKFGTKIKFSFKAKNKSDQIIDYEDRYSVIALHSFDFIKDEKVNYQGLKVLDEVIRFSDGTFIPVNLYFNGEIIKQITQKIKFDYIDAECGLQLCIDDSNSIEQDRSLIYFRNQVIRNSYFFTPFISFHINILKGNATDILTLNRDSIRTSYRDELMDNIKRTTIKYLNNNFDNLNSLKKQLASMYIAYHRQYIEENNLSDIIFHDDWKDFQVYVTKNLTEEKIKKNIKDLIEAKTIEFIINEDSPDCIIFTIENEKYAVKEMEADYNYIYRFILRISQKDYNLSFKKNGYILSDNKANLIENSDEAREWLMNCYLNIDDGARDFFPCSEKYSALQIKPGLYKQHQIVNPALEYPYMVCPYIRIFDDRQDSAIGLKYDVDNKVLDFVYANRANLETTKDEIEKAYDQFQKDWSSIIEQVNAKIKEDQTSIERYGKRRRCIFSRFIASK